MAYGVTHTDLDARTIPESYISLRSVKKVPFGTAKITPEVVVESISLKSPCMVVENECMIVVGKSLIDAFDKLEVAEFTAKTLIQAKLMGDAVSITQDEIDKIHKVLIK